MKVKKESSRFVLGQCVPKPHKPTAILQVCQQGGFSNGSIEVPQKDL